MKILAPLPKVSWLNSQLCWWHSLLVCVPVYNFWVLNRSSGDLPCCAFLLFGSFGRVFPFLMVKTLLTNPVPAYMVKGEFYSHCVLWCCSSAKTNLFMLVNDRWPNWDWREKITDFPNLPKHAGFGELLRLLFNPLENIVPDAQA